MRRYVSFQVVTLVVGSLFTVGCNLDQSPTGPTSLSAARLSSAKVASTVGASSSTDVLKIPVTFTIQPSAKLAIQTCVGEVVTFVGEANLVAHETTLPDGSISLDLLHLNGQGAVGGSSGATYHVVSADSNPIVL